MTAISFKKILGIDYGTKVVGLATYAEGSDPYPLPYGKLIYRGDKELTREILKIVESEEVDLVVLGLPLYTDGRESEMTARVRKYGLSLEAKLPQNASLIFQDETLSSFEAQDRMKNSPRYNFKVDLEQIDALSASIIIEDFLRKSL